MEQTPEAKKINPQITQVEIGVRDLRNITLYPLALGDQLKLTDMIEEGLQAFFKVEQGSEESLTMFMAFMFGLIKKNLPRMLSLVALDEDAEKAMAEITNQQLDDIVQVVYEKNFASLKNLKGLFDKLKTRAV
jgi:hypothetical protein